MAQKLKIRNFKKSSKTFLNKGTKNLKNDMECLNSKNIYIKDGGSP